MRPKWASTTARERCVRRAFLCGEDSVTGTSYEHRKEWIRQRLEYLAGQFAVDVLGLVSKKYSGI